MMAARSQLLPEERSSGSRALKFFFFNRQLASYIPRITDGTQTWAQSGPVICEVPVYLSLIGSPINYANHLIGSSITSQSTDPGFYTPGIPQYSAMGTGDISCGCQVLLSDGRRRFAGDFDSRRAGCGHSRVPEGGAGACGGCAVSQCRRVSGGGPAGQPAAAVPGPPAQCPEPCIPSSAAAAAP